MISAIIVMHYPNIQFLQRLLMSLNKQVQNVIAVDNTPGSSATSSPFNGLYEYTTEYIPLGENRGIAEAQNVGIGLSVRNEYSHVLLLDQDSELSPNMVNRLMKAERKLLDRGINIAGMSPRVIDRRTGNRPCACIYKWLRAREIYCTTATADPVPTDSFIASGSLIRTSTLQVLGVMRSDLFIDHVDTEWALRGRSHGYDSYCFPDAVLWHKCGDATAKVLGKNIYLHNDIRRYYQLRNEVYLARLRTMGWQWRAYILPRIVYHYVLYAALSKKPIRAYRILLKAFCDGIAGRLGPATPEMTSLLLSDS